MRFGARILTVIVFLLAAASAPALVIVDQVSGALAIPPGSGLVSTTSDFSRPFQIADGFTVDAGQSIRMTRVEWVGLPRAQLFGNGGTVLDFAVRFFHFVDGVVQVAPFAELDVTSQVSEAATSHPSLSLYSADISSPIILPGNGTYFFSVVANTPDTTEDWWWFFLDGPTMSYHRYVDGENWIERLPRSYSFRLHGELMPDPVVLLEELRAAVTGVGPGKSLVNKLTLAQAYYAAGDIPATCAVLTDFVSTVQQMASGKKPKLSPAIAAELTADAEEIMRAIGCS
jgi:hypothetical protein